MEIMKIKEYVNYSDSDRVKLHFTTTDDNKHQNALVFSDKIYIKDKEETIQYSDIRKIELYLCSRVYNPAIVAAGPIDYIKAKYTSGAIVTVGGGLIMYSLDMNIETNNKSYVFESYSLNNILEILQLLKDKDIKIIDDLGIYNMLVKYSDKMELQTYLHKNFPEWAKKFNLENPRGTLSILGEKVEKKNREAK